MATNNLDEQLLGGREGKPSSRFGLRTEPQRCEDDLADELEAHPLLEDASDSAWANKEAGATSMQAFMNTYRAIVGTGVLALPSAIKGCGLGYGVIFLIM
eukprot:9478696-Pyramimonas_sp.AAC.1